MDALERHDADKAWLFWKSFVDVWSRRGELMAKEVMGWQCRNAVSGAGLGLHFLIGQVMTSLQGFDS